MYDIKEEEIQKLRNLSSEQETFSTVYEGCCRNKRVAIKVFKQNLSPEEQEVFLKEISLFGTISHPNICLFMGTLTNHFTIITELMDMNLLQIFKEKEAVSLFTRIYLAKGVALGLNWLHDRVPKIIHGSLTPSNILVNRDYRAKISDFGLYKIKNQSVNLLQGDVDPGDLRWYAPEVLQGEEPTEKSDVYSFGLILWALLTNQIPYATAKTVFELKQLKCVLNQSPPMIECCKSLLDLITECTSPSPTFRPPFKAMIVRLEIILIDIAITDTVGNSFWRKHWRDKITVDWIEFMNAFAVELHLLTNRTPIMTLYNSKSPVLEGTDIPVNIKCLKALLAEPISPDVSTLVVSLELFGKAIGWFGPLESKDKGQKFLERVRCTLLSTWFHGSITTRDSELALHTQPVGTFLVRFSTSSTGAFAISKVAIRNNNKFIQHQRFMHDVAKDNYFIQKEDHVCNCYSSIVELIENEKVSLGLLHPCLGSPYSSILMTEDFKGYVNLNKIKSEN
uniref:Non-specific protein-tyrosine kinase n=1 Tax=Arcella intermedia TaxID=1963864 RepID=A0A6B2L1X7_9EUKA